jgi:maleylpyruvate isomerase
VSRRTATVVNALSAAGALDAPSLLPGWTRLTIACHLRYGAEASLRLTRAAIAGEPATFYPRGRATQRPGTLVPAPGEDVVAALSAVGDELDRAWLQLSDSDWGRVVAEPPGVTDLGPLPIRAIALLRLTEVEVHGTDLDLALPDWSPVLVDAALPFRINRLRPGTRTYRFTATDGGSWLVGGATPPEAEIVASRRDLLALLLGRPMLAPPVSTFGFEEAYPGP